MNLCHAYYVINDFGNVELYAKKVLEKSMNYKALLWMSLQFLKQRLNSFKMQEIVFIELAHAFAALCVQFVKNRSTTIDMIKRKGINISRAHVKEVETSEELYNSVIYASMNSSNGEKYVIYIKAGVYMYNLNPAILPIMVHNVLIGDLSSSKPKLILQNEITPITAANIFLNIN